jgi:hypothetical protein
MKQASSGAIALVILALAGCGAGSGSGTTAGSGPRYDFVTPPLNSTTRYSETILDSANNTIDVGFTRTVTAVNADGSYVVLSEDPNHNTVIVNGTNYSIVTETESLNSSGHETSFQFVAASGSLVTCTFNPHGDGPVFPLSVGETWTLDYTYACGAQSPIAYTQVGSVVGLEAITVPAGTYSALKLESTVTWTDPAGTTRTETITNWRDVATLISVKQEISVSSSGTVPSNGYAVNRVILLQSAS